MDNQFGQQTPKPSPQPVPTQPRGGFDLSLDEAGNTGLTVEGSGKPPRSKKKLLLVSAISFTILAVGLVVGLFVWYSVQLSPVDHKDTAKVLVTIEKGATPNGIASTLEEKGLIRSQIAFLWHARFNGVQNLLQAGTYRLSPSESTPQIVEHLSSGKVDVFTVTFLPGHTLKEHKEVLLSAGYDSEEIDAAFAKKYDSPLFAAKPASADLEGYIYGETYTFSSEASVESILEHTFDEFYKVIQKNNLVSKFKARGLSLYEGIVLSSIVQRESGSIPKDMAKIAQVFYNRLAIDMPLGSDPTYQYAADKLGVPRDTNLDSPYNTRRVAGLPPGPIASPGVKALIATATPQKNDFLYFLSGDDDVTYFSRTFEEHERNIVDHCQKKCQIL